MRYLVPLLAAILLPLSAPLSAQDTLLPSEKTAVLKNAQAIVERDYVYPEKADEISRVIEALLQSGKYDAITDHKAFAKSVTKDLVAATKDKHFALVYNPGFIAARRRDRERERQTQEAPQTAVAKAPESPRIDWNYWFAQQDNFGFEKVEVLGGNIGYVKLTFFQPRDWVKPTIDATMGFLANTDALIIDLRDNQGGYSPTDAYWASYFFDEGPALWVSDYNRPRNETSDVNLFPEVGGAKYLDKPIYILVSEKTFSLAEKFAYGLKHFGKATIVGQTTSGAAHGIDIGELSENYFIQIPTSRNIHPVTKTDWEGVGVVVDVEVPHEDALRSAQMRILDTFIENAPHERMRKVFSEKKAELAAAE